MAKIITVTASDGTTVRFFDEVKAQGGVKDVMFSPDKSYVVAFYREKATAATRERLLEITGRYRENIFNKEGGSYLQKLFCWPSAVVEHNQRLGVVVPFYRDIFFFKHGSQNNDQLGIRHKEKVGKWFATPTHRAKYLDSRELGDWRLHLQVCLMLARAVRRMHMAGLSHSDLGYNNCLVDPTTGQACLIDLDGLVVPGKHPPSVIGTPDFIAPEVVKTAHMPIGDADRKLPSRVTDLHALAVMIYMYLLYRHPLRGDKFHDTDASLPVPAVNRFRLRFRHKSGLRQPASRYLPVNLSSLLTSHGGTVDRQTRYYAVCLFAPGMTSRCCSLRVHCLLLVSPDS